MMIISEDGNNDLQKDEEVHFYSYDQNVFNQRKDTVIRDEENILKQWENISFFIRDCRQKGF